VVARTGWVAIPKLGDVYPRTLQIRGAESVVMTEHKRGDLISTGGASPVRGINLAEDRGGAGYPECAHPAGGVRAGKTA